ncbi:SDR family NAD(P)-dependent oxidoreductase [Actinosynnema sp. NPDC020468]|uniref:SDR family NAD(P)-dependent oxidoreductase n=1 Tax=Actinosynnema sp. NPDC020468 TaxID=3154488 RepID=UPI003401235C
MSRIAVVTGANQGLGFALVADLAERFGNEDLVLLTGRDRGRVEEAVSRVGGRAGVEGRVLDVTDAAAVAELARELGPVDVVLSNAVAPLSPDRSQAAQAEEFAAVANGGAHAVLREFGPGLRAGGRLVVVASGLGTLGNLDPALWPLFDGRSLDEVERVVGDWVAAARAGRAEERGWPRWVNVPSKVAQVAAVRAVAATRRDADLSAGTLVAAVCPGLVDTRASRPWFDDFSGALTPARAAAAVLDFVLGPVDPATHGELVRYGRVLPWHGGTPHQGADLIP